MCFMALLVFPLAVVMVMFLMDAVMGYKDNDALHAL